MIDTIIGGPASRLYLQGPDESKEHNPNPRNFRCKGFVACEPPTPTGVTEYERNGVVYMDIKTTMIKMKVMFPDDEFKHPAGWQVYVKSDRQNLPWFIDVYDVEGMKFVLVPVGDVLMSSRI